MIDLIKRSNFCLETFVYLLHFASYNTKSESSRIFRGWFHPLRVNLGSKQKLPCKQKEIPYILTKFQNFLNFRVRDLPLLVSCLFGGATNISPFATRLLIMKIICPVIYFPMMRNFCRITTLFRNYHLWKSLGKGWSNITWSFKVLSGTGGKLAFTQRNRDSCNFL